MGEIAEMMLDGTMDPETGEFNFNGEDGPGWPMTAAEAAEYRGFVGGGHRPPARGPAPIHGFWRRVAEAVQGGAVGTVTVARAIHASHTDTKRAIQAMVAAGYLHRDTGTLALTKRCRRELSSTS